MQARDLKQLCSVSNEDAFRLESMQICDMFPQTTHVESVAVLQRFRKFDRNASEKNTYVKNKGIDKPTPSRRLMWEDEMWRTILHCWSDLGPAKSTLSF